VAWSQRLLICLLGIVCAQACAQSPVILTGEWPPYTGIREPQGGSVTAIVRQAFAAEGDEPRVGFFAWSRVRKMVTLNQAYIAKFPDYYSSARLHDCYFSNPIGESPLGLAEQSGHVLSWEKVGDLQRYRLGLVSSYVNTPELDKLVAAGKIKAVMADDDADNLRNLQMGRVDAAVIDRNVYAYLLRPGGDLEEVSPQLRLNPRVLIVHKLYMCFQHTEHGRHMRDRFNRGLKTMQAPVP
jgi:polar amino acid transport system substrate-binding protein